MIKSVPTKPGTSYDIRLVLISLSISLAITLNPYLSLFLLALINILIRVPIIISFCMMLTLASFLANGEWVTHSVPGADDVYAYIRMLEDAINRDYAYVFQAYRFEPFFFLYLLICSWLLVDPLNFPFLHYAIVLLLLFFVAYQCSNRYPVIVIFFLLFGFSNLGDQLLLTWWRQALATVPLALGFLEMRRGRTPVLMFFLALGIHLSAIIFIIFCLSFYILDKRFNNVIFQISFGIISGILCSLLMNTLVVQLASAYLNREHYNFALTEIDGGVSFGSFLIFLLYLVLQWKRRRSFDYRFVVALFSFGIAFIALPIPGALLRSFDPFSIISSFTVFLIFLGFRSRIMKSLLLLGFFIYKILIVEKITVFYAFFPNIFTLFTGVTIIPGI